MATRLLLTKLPRSIRSKGGKNGGWTHAKRGYADECKVNRGLILGLYEQEQNDAPVMTAAAEKYNEKLSGKLMEMIKEFGMDGKLGTEKIINNVDNMYQAISIVGLGKEGVGYNELEAIDMGMENVRIGAAVGARSLQKEGCTHIAVDPMEYSEQAAEGSVMAVWMMQDNKTEKKRMVIPKMDLLEPGDPEEWTRGVYKAEAQNSARRFSDAAANQMTPTDFAQEAVELLCPCGVTCEVRNMDWIIAQNMTSFLSVARSSCEPPVFLEMTYCGGALEEKPVLLIGTGITYNSGGLNLNKMPGLSEYRASMAGAAAVVATMRAVASLSLPINVSAVCPLCENMPSGMAFKPGDVITCLNGKTIGVHNTNNADLLIMADTLCYGQTTFRPRLIVDVSTTTEGVLSGLSEACSGVFSNSHFMWKQMHRAGAITGDRVWRLPLWKHFSHKVTDYSGLDVSNTGRGEGQTCLAAAFIKEFCPCIDWVHMDIFGTGRNIVCPNFPYLAQGRMTGRPTRTLIQFLYQLACPSEATMEKLN